MILIFIRSRIAPALLRPDFFRNVDIPEQVIAGVKGFERVAGAEIAAGAVIIASHLQPVMDATENEFR